MAITPEEFLERLDELLALFDEPSTLPGVHGARALVSAMGVDDEAITHAFNAVDHSPALRAAVGATTEELHASRDLYGRWRTVESRLRGLLNTVHNANLIRRHKLGTTGLQIYQMSRQLIRQPEHAALETSVELMEPHIRRRWRGPRRKAEQPAK